MVFNIQLNEDLSRELKVFFKSLQYFVEKNKNSKKFETFEEFEKIVPRTFNKDDSFYDKVVITYSLSSYSSDILSDHLLSHSFRVGIILGFMAQKFNEINEKKVDISSAIFGGFLHDIGHLFTPKSIHMKNGKLNPTEREIVKKHTLNGFILLDKLGCVNKEILSIALYHHEQANGNGYYYLDNNDVSLLVKFSKIVDLYDALRAKRSYKSEESCSNVISFLKEEQMKYKMFDNNVFSLFLSIIDDVEFLFKKEFCEKYLENI